VRPSLKNKLKAKGLGMVHVAENLPDKHKALNSIFSTTKKNKKNRRITLL
jgi:hypothetical protein